MSTGKSDNDYVKIKLRRYPTSIMSDLYGFRMSLFEHVETEEVLLFIRNFNMIIAITGTLETDTMVQYPCTLFCGEALCQFDLLSTDVENTDTSLTVDDILKGLACNSPLVNSISKQMRAMRRCMKNYAA